jgi:hypothetical protein
LNSVAARSTSDSLTLPPILQYLITNTIASKFVASLHQIASSSFTPLPQNKQTCGNPAT